MKLLFDLVKLPVAAELHGDMTQVQRFESISKFRNAKTKYLLCTDLASRGLDIPMVQTVINFDAPYRLTNYFHRIGRSARLGKSGRAITIIEDGDRPLLKQILKQKNKANIQLCTIPPQEISNWLERLKALQVDFQSILALEKKERSKHTLKTDIKNVCK